MAQIANSYGVRHTLSRVGRRWRLHLHVNPSVDAFFDGDEREEVRRILRAAGRTVTSLQQALTRAYREARAQGLSRPQARAQARESVGGVEGLRTGAAAHPELRAPVSRTEAGTRALRQGEAHEDELRERLTREGEARGFIAAGGRDERGHGFDVLLVHPERGEVVAPEIKRGALRALHARASARGRRVPSEQRIALNPSGPGGTVAQRHLSAHPEDAARIARGHVLEGADRDFQNKLSAITYRLEANLDAAIAQIQDARTKADPADAPRYTRAVALLREIRERRGGALRRIVIADTVSEAERAVAMQILAASRQQLGSVAVEDLIRLASDDNLIGGA